MPEFMHFGKFRNGIRRFPKPIPDTIPDTDPYIKTIGTSCELPNVSYTSSDEQKDENGKSGYYNNLSTPDNAVWQPHDSKIKNVKSDYFDNQT